MRQLKIGQRLGLAFGLLLAILAGIALLSLNRLADLDQKIDLVAHDRYPKVALATRVFEDIEETSLHLRNLAIVTAPDDARRERAALAATEAETETVLAELSARITMEKGRKLVAGLMAAKQSYEGQRTAYLDLLAKGERERAAALLLGRLSDELVTYQQLGAKLSRIGGVLMNESAEEAATVYRQGVLTISGMTLAALLVAAGLGYRISRGITMPLERAVSVAETIATGNLACDIECAGADETGRLLHALQGMKASLAGIVIGVRANAEAIAEGAAEIAGGTSDLSTRTEQQAGSLEETASAMEELTGTVKQSADNARGALDVARNAAAVAERSGAEVRRVLERMDAIEESSHRIRDIIGVIDGIAFQTNILALNAAVEAARAGDMGRGFAVVASEVRNLAQRSAGAAREIKHLIEESVDKVAAGSNHARQAGATMDSVLVEIRRVAALMHDIDTASREQTAGIEQINAAMAQMDHVTQQNASLVEEAAAAAESMHRRTEAMSASVSIFVVEPQRVAALAWLP